MQEKPKSSKNYVTPEGFKKLREEFDFLINKDRPKVVEVVSWAASNGDRSENADYTYGKKRLREIDRRLKFLRDRMDSSEVVDPKLIKSDKVVFGATVTILDEDENEKIYQIVGEDEFDIKAGKISWKSPVATALLGKKVDDDVIIRKPNGEEVFTIVKIEFI